MEAPETASAAAPAHDIDTVIGPGEDEIQFSLLATTPALVSSRLEVPTAINLSLPIIGGGSANPRQEVQEEMKASGWLRVTEDMHAPGDNTAAPRLRPSRTPIGKSNPDNTSDSDFSAPPSTTTPPPATISDTAAQHPKPPKRPLHLLDLPIDVLKDIIKEVTHTNDLTALALCHSALHSLAIPHIYSRFDIVWPDSSAHAEPRAGVDALTYGLATLVMAEEIFGEGPSYHHQRKDHSTNRHGSSTGGRNRFHPHARAGVRPSENAIRRRRGNHYASFTRKFSLGNGPAEWVQEYLITKEGGKMLGTLVALAVARMRALETFVWDMPTGILRDVWMALASLGERAEEEGRECRLERVWVRWHDNSGAVDAVGGGGRWPHPQHQVVHHHQPHPPPMPMLASPHLHHPSMSPFGSGGAGAPGMDPHSPPHHYPPHYHPQPLLAQNAPPPPPPQHNMFGNPLPPTTTTTTTTGTHPPPPLPSAYPTSTSSLTRTEHPSFSLLPPLRSLSVLDIDEQSYLDEMSVLLGRSAEKLRELRVGLARHAVGRKWTKVWEGSALVQVDRVYPTASSMSVGEKRWGGVLGVLVGLVWDARMGKKAGLEKDRRGKEGGQGVPEEEVVEREASLVAESGSKESWSDRRSSDPTTNDPSSTTDSTSITAPDADDPPRRMLRLEVLELERVPLSIPVLQAAIDWTHLTALTLLNCPNHEQLWKSLRRDFAPTPKSPTYPLPVGPSRRRSSISPRKPRNSLSGNIPGSAANSTIADDSTDLVYPLRIKKLHTNTVSSSLIAFLRDTLAPNSLEELYLQDSSPASFYSSTVTIDAIFRGPLRRHRASLRKLLIDSAERDPVDGTPVESSSKWRKWLLKREVLAFVVGGKMPGLRELGAAVEYRDWHFLLQSLPSMPHLRSLYIPFLADHVHGANVDPKELALQFVDIVALRPEIELCYMGIANKCFEILESRRGGNGNEGAGRSESESAAAADQYHHHGFHQLGEVELAEEEEEEEEGEEEEDEDEEGEEDDTESDDEDAHDDDDDDEDDDDLDDPTDSESEASDVSSDADADAHHDRPLRLREILFYDDKVAIFKARHGRL